MINTEPNNDIYKERLRAAGVYTRPDSNALCESLVSKLTEKNDDEKPKPRGKGYYCSNNDSPEPMSETEDSEKADEESDWSSAPASPVPLKTPRAFEKSDHLYEKQMEKENAKESEDWTWESEEFLQDDREILKDTDNSYKP